MFYKNILKTETDEGRHVYYKPHPADLIDAHVYENPKVHILSKDFPVELLNYKDVEFGKVMSFGSTGIDTITCAAKHEMLFEDRGGSIEEVKKRIKSDVKGKKVIVDLYFPLNRFDSDAFISVFGSLLNRKQVKFRSHIIVEKQNFKEAGRFIEKDPAEMADKYRKNHTYLNECPWADMLDKMVEKFDKLQKPDILMCDDLNNDEEVFDICARHKDDYDFLMIVEEGNQMFSVTKSIAITMRKVLCMVILFQKHTELVDKTLAYPFQTLSSGFIMETINSELVNRVWHRSIVSKFLNEDGIKDEYQRAIILSNYKSLVRKFTDDLAVSVYRYYNIENGKEYYQKKIYKWNSQNIDQELKTDQMALVLFEYMDWFRITGNVYNLEMIHDFVNELDLESETKIMILERLSTSLLFEKIRKFAVGRGERQEYKEYLLRKKQSELKKDKKTKEPSLTKKVIRKILR